MRAYLWSVLAVFFCICLMFTYLGLHAKPLTPRQYWHSIGSVDPCEKRR